MGLRPRLEGWLHVAFSTSASGKSEAPVFQETHTLLSQNRRDEKATPEGLLWLLFQFIAKTARNEQAVAGLCQTPPSAAVCCLCAGCFAWAMPCIWHGPVCVSGPHGCFRPYARAMSAVRDEAQRHTSTEKRAVRAPCRRPSSRCYCPQTGSRVSLKRSRSRPAARRASRGPQGRAAETWPWACSLWLGRQAAARQAAAEGGHPLHQCLCQSHCARDLAGGCSQLFSFPQCSELVQLPSACTAAGKMRSAFAP